MTTPYTTTAAIKAADPNPTIMINGFKKSIVFPFRKGVDLDAENSAFSYNSLRLCRRPSAFWLGISPGDCAQELALMYST